MLQLHDLGAVTETPEEPSGDTEEFTSELAQNLLFKEKRPKKKEAYQEERQADPRRPFTDQMRTPRGTAAKEFSHAEMSLLR